MLAYKDHVISPEKADSTKCRIKRNAVCASGSRAEKELHKHFGLEMILSRVQILDIDLWDLMVFLLGFGFALN